MTVILRLQRATAQDVGCKRTFANRVPGAKRNRRELAEMTGLLHEEDTLGGFNRSVRSVGQAT